MRLCVCLCVGGPFYLSCLFGKSACLNCIQGVTCLVSKEC